jgi:hypothetical protein
MKKVRVDKRSYFQMEKKTMIPQTWNIVKKRGKWQMLGTNAAAFLRTKVVCKKGKN